MAFYNGICRRIIVAPTDSRVIGAEPLLRPALRELDLARGDILLLCSDGLTEHLTDGEIEVHVNSTDDLGSAVDRLIEAAKHAGGSDNVTVVLVRC